MQEHEARVRAFYDHEVEEPRTARRRRQVADWGVGEDIFDRMPSRRFSRAEGAHARRPAELASPARPVAGDEVAEPRAGERPASAAGERASSAAADRPSAAAAEPPASAAGGAADVAARAHARRPVGFGEDLTQVPRPAMPRGKTDDGRRTIVIGEPRDEDVAVAVDGRRTVVIGARRAHPSPRRPPRRAAERVGPRPDRIVAYAVALGVLLILIAILSAGH